MAKPTLQSVLSIFNSTLVEFGLLAMAFSAVKHWGTPLPTAFEWGLAAFFLGSALFVGTLLLSRKAIRGHFSGAHEKAMALASTPALLAAASCLVLSAAA